MRTIPATMATQHPDNACEHPFSGSKLVAVQEEAEEAHWCFSQLGCAEFMWDWEGKHVDEAVVEKLLEAHPEFYREHALGKDLFLTFRVPNVWKEKGYRVARAFANVIAANDLMEELQLHAPPVFELILPMTTSARELFILRTKYMEIVKAFEIVKPPGPEDVDLIPLVEEAPEMLHLGGLLREYYQLCEKGRFKKFDLPYIRPFLARSDPALNAGLVAAVLGVKAGLGECALFSEETGVPAFPMLGVGSLPFRGRLNPENLQAFLREYEGVRTVTVQSAFRTDYRLPEAKMAVAKLNEELKEKPRALEGGAKEVLGKLIALFSQEYQQAVERIAPTVQQMAVWIPQRRERKQHTGLFGYSREVGKRALPRAIGYTAALYSLGVPPEFIGTGRGLAKARKEGLEETLTRHYLNLKSDLEFAAGFLNRDNLDALANAEAAWKLVQEDVELVEELLGIEMGPTTQAQEQHLKRTSRIRSLLGKGQNARHDVEEAARLRKSLG